ncbi:MAG TPA: histidine kinase [Actinophytocola sp.]|uniref:sensor histidine kinase n=1 Tax=Actinophytocola sp. TaxID=1872138 RepID=UPI002DBE56AF|nr:histidine kinase [Actinophytocola sp.]HEU5470922.1 histidine kinase [Actinophytocola sp.]
MIAQRLWGPIRFRPQPARLARATVVAIFGGLAAMAFVRILDEHVSNGLSLTVSLVSLVAVLLLTILWFSRLSERPRSLIGYPALAALVVLVYLPVLLLADPWPVMPGFLAGSLLLALPPAVSLPGFVAVVASMGLLQTLNSGQFGHRAADVAYVCISTAVVGLVVFGISRLAQLVTELHVARVEIAQIVVMQERLRFARDVHDLLGYSISAIALKSELAHRLVTKDPDRAGAEITDILSISRQALADVRTLSSNYRELSLADECRSAKWVLASAGIEVRMSLSEPALPVPVGTVLATVLREGVTNILRHSKAERCEITVAQTGGTASIEIVNDGAGTLSPTADLIGGEGLRNLAARAGELGGALTAGRIGEQNFRLRADIPLDQ